VRVAVDANAISGAAGTAGKSTSRLSGFRARFPAKHACAEPDAWLCVDPHAARRHL
jgi:hypothetical protein